MAHPKNTRNWTIRKHSPSVMELRFDEAHGQVLLISDVHWDNAHCDRQALKRDLDEAMEKGAPICMFGDTFCLMQGKWDPRSSKRQLLPEHATSDKYLDLVAEDAAKWFSPYAKNIALITQGNHESSIVNRHGTDPVGNFHTRLSVANPEAYNGVTGAFAGFLKIAVQVAGANAEKSLAKTLYWHHGYGGGGEVTRGMIDQSRTRGQAEADIYFSGHIHRRNSDENAMQRLDVRNMVIEVRQQYFLRASTYKREEGSQHNDLSGWHVEKGRAA
jgi:hypothetical protein